MKSFIRSLINNQEKYFYFVGYRFSTLSRQWDASPALKGISVALFLPVWKLMPWLFPLGLSFLDLYRIIISPVYKN